MSGTGRFTWYQTPVGYAALSAILFLGVGLRYTAGRFTPPLDDTAIHIQYAEQIARGQYYRYHDGDPRTSGATSWLYVHLLAIPSLFGLHGTGLLAASLLLGAVLLCITVAFASRLMAKDGLVAQRRLGLLLAFHGALLWSFLSGMEIALFDMLLLGVLLAYRNESHLVSSRDGFRATIPLLVLLALVRPEGGFVAVVIAGAVTLRMLHARASRRRVAIHVLLPVGGAVIWPHLWTRLSTGGWSSSGLLAKSLFAEPTMTWAEKVVQLAENIRGIFWWFYGTPEYGGWFAEYLPPGGILLACLGVASLVRRGSETGWRRLLGIGPIAALSTLVIAASVSTLSVWSLHNYRYLLPVVPVILFLLVAGLEEMGRWGRCGLVSSRLLFILILMAQLAIMPLWLSRYGRNCGSIGVKQRELAEWIAIRTDPEVRVAINDAGILTLFSRRHTVDLVGLMSNDTTIPYRLGEGSLYEYLSELSEQERFQYYAVFPEWFELFRTFDLLGKPIVRFPDPFDRSYEKVLYHAVWRTSGIDAYRRDSAVPPKRRGWVLVDQLDVADIASEREHEYTCEPGERFPPHPVPFRRNFGYHEEIEQLFPGEKDRDLIPRLAEEGRLEQFDILDAGRRHSGSERFKVGGLRPGVDLAIVLRTCQDESEYDHFQYEMVISVDRAFAGRWKISGTPWNWYERWLIIPGSLITDSETEIRLTAMPTDTDPYYASYYYWFLQPPPEEIGSELGT